MASIKKQLPVVKPIISVPSQNLKRLQQRKKKNVDEYNENPIVEESQLSTDLTYKVAIDGVGYKSDKVLVSVDDDASKPFGTLSQKPEDMMLENNLLPVIYLPLFCVLIANIICYYTSFKLRSQYQ